MLIKSCSFSQILSSAGAPERQLISITFATVLPRPLLMRPALRLFFFLCFQFMPRRPCSRTAFLPLHF